MLNVQRKSVDDLELIIFVSDENSFMITTTLITKGSRAVLIGTSFTKDDANEIAQFIKNNEYSLESIYLLHGDPDYYFGLEQIKQYFPKVIAYSTQSTFSHIAKTVESKLTVWSETLGNQLPQNIVMPKIIQENKFEIFEENWEIVGEKKRTNLWNSKKNILIGGIDTFNEINLFLADTASSPELEQWINRLDLLIDLNSEIVIPSHSSAKKSYDKKALEFEKKYIQTVLKIMKNVKKSDQFIDEVKKEFPNLENESVLALSAKVLTKEINWG
ncbi:cytoplasmic protein [Companilactobacillus sp. DQM5]|uniref:cytoplasmic protein n=1 Tax=Companilactobacillus sp. DQM5 TaxID=3463359 RepID=UPI004059D7F4